MQEKMKSRKWIAFIWVMLIETICIGFGLYKFVMSDPIATGFIIACFSAINGTLAFYFTGNIIQKKIIGVSENGK